MCNFHYQSLINPFKSYSAHLITSCGALHKNDSLRALARAGCCAHGSYYDCKGPWLALVGPWLALVGPFLALNA